MSENISKYRSEVIEKFINIEWIINMIISFHYFGVLKENFSYDVLYDEYFSFGLKRRILEKVLTNRNKLDKSIIDKLNRMNTIRNYFAHCHNVVSKHGSEKYIPDPRDTDKPVDFEKLHSEFVKNEKIVNDYLLDFFKMMGGEYK